jgi:hypothetical protein
VSGLERLIYVSICQHHTGCGELQCTDQHLPDQRSGLCREMREGGHGNPQTAGSPHCGRGWKRQHLPEVIRKPYLSILDTSAIARHMQIYKLAAWFI